MLTNAAVKAARPRAAAFKIYDEGGLHLYVAPNGRRSFRMRYRLAGREQLLTFGTWPDVSLAEARERCEAARDALRAGEDPRAQPHSAPPAAETFEQIARRWHARTLPRWTPVHAGDVLASLTRDVFPAIGAMPIGAITTPVVLAALHEVEARGRLETARRVRQRISAVFAHARAEGIVDADPAAIVARALAPTPAQRHHPALLDIADARALLAAVEQVGAAPAAKLASRFLALTAVRLAAVRGARWDEIEDLDGAAPRWRVPATRMKMRRARKADRANDHIVPLAPAAVAVLRAAWPLSTGAGLIFPGRGATRPLGEGALGELYDRAGYAGRHVPHGWRATFSTAMNRTGNFDAELIERALAHAPKDRIRAAYDRDDHLDRRRALFHAWAVLLTED
ncbi:integrase arm-type DNA-binding domain-containing protein [Sphingomonas sp. GM_Shp_2]|uniref:tyrosine-type recombinase/integrase n=1 Tax=Sphingomonas sp. GM_Shp_2 TaxID=2937380 RepID=UPI00226AF0D1|nr:integrase arm-type DNA-binding domain-containing protein [Sphingomonas sp. GM_Shp_2]